MAGATATALDEETTAKVLRQVEYYFGDKSFSNDKFLLKEVEESDDGLVKLSLLCGFKKMRDHLGVKEKDVNDDQVAAVAEVLRKSTFLKLSEDGKRIGRVKKYDPEVVKAEVDARSIACNPLPYKIGMEKVEAIFKPHAEVKSVQLPKHKGGQIPSGFAVIEFSKRKVARKVLEMKLTCEGVTLELEPKTTFDARKEELLKNDAGKKEDLQGEITKGLIVSFNAKRIEGKAAKKTEEAAEETEEAAEETEEAAEAADTEGEGGEQLSREDIKEGLTMFGTIRYVDYAKGKESGFLRFTEPEDAQKLTAAGKLTIAKHLVTFEALEGEAEEIYWKNLRESQAHKKGRGGGGRRGGRGGRGGRGWGPKRPSDSEGPKSKSQKTE